MAVTSSGPNTCVAAPLGYVPSLDGLRALAVVVVMLAHANATAIRGGIIGVDIFFVLSGFLITTIVIEERSSRGGFRFGRFYLRRILRLWPALFFMLGVVAVYALVQAPDHYRADTLQSAVSSALYLANWPHPFGTESIFLNHTWSLALEEQFYLVWPPVLILAWRRVPARQILWGVLAIAAIVAVLRPMTTFFLFDQRPDTLLLGCCLALARFVSPREFQTANRLPVGLVGLGVIGLAVVGPGRGLTPEMMRGGGFVLVALGASALIAHLVTADSVLRRLFELAPVVAIGRISYALYLWHVPVYKWFFVETTFPGPINLLLKVSVTFGLAIASFYLVEEPARRLKKRLEPRLPGRDRVL